MLLYAPRPIRTIHELRSLVLTNSMQLELDKTFVCTSQKMCKMFSAHGQDRVLFTRIFNAKTLRVWEKSNSYAHVCRITIRLKKKKVLHNHLPIRFLFVERGDTKCLHLDDSYTFIYRLFSDVVFAERHDMLIAV